MTVVTGLRSMMLTNVTRTVRNRRTVTLLGIAEMVEDCTNVASGILKILNIIMDYNYTFRQKRQSILP